MASQPLALIAGSPQVLDPPTPKVRLERNLNSLGFFTATYKASHSKLHRVIELGTMEIEGKRTSRRVEIVGNERWGGLPSGSDRDKYYAFMTIVNNARKTTGLVENPVRFTSYELLARLNLKPTGKAYAAVHGWLDRMVNTSILSEYAVQFRGRRKWARDTFHVFDRVISMGEDLEDGSKADCNNVWMSVWQLENINADYVFPVDMTDYLSLRNDIAKALLSHLVSWFFATQGRPFEKRYDILCSLLGISPRPTAALIRQAFNPSMNELIKLGYLKSWEVARIDSDTPPTFKICFLPGTRYSALAREPITAPKAAPLSNVTAKAQLLVDQGVRPDIAERLLTDVGIAHEIDLKLAYFGYLRQQMGRRMGNPPGFLVDLLRSKAPVPANLQARLAEVQRAALPPSPEEEAAVERAMRDMELRNLYGDMCDEKAREYSDAHPAEAAKLRDAAAKRVRKQKPDLIAQGEGHFYREVQRDVEVQILKLARVPAFDEWSQAMRQSSLF